MLLGILAVLIIGILYFFVGKPPRTEHMIWGVNFSQKHASQLGLDWKETYVAFLDDLGAKHLKVAAHWDLLEPERDNFRFEDLDWQVREAEKRGAQILMVIGMKTPRWPECHIPKWAKDLEKEAQQERILVMIEKVVRRYKDSSAMWAWQVENEPFFPFGECPWVDKKFVQKEVTLVKSLDPARPIVMADSGEGSFWITAAKIGDIVGTTLYEKVWFRQIKRYITYPFPPVFYWRKAQLIDKLFGKEVIGVELQAEPWGPKLLYDLSLEEQKKTMDVSRFQKNVEFARQTGLKKFYLWGGEWWFWLKEKHNDASLWEEAKRLFQF